MVFSPFKLTAKARRFPPHDGRHINTLIVANFFVFDQAHGFLGGNVQGEKAEKASHPDVKGGYSSLNQPLFS
ncbi:hypothetical protein LFZ31_27025, partial [Salmonella enterica subsp. enterica serovar Newport str. S09097]